MRTALLLAGVLNFFIAYGLWRMLIQELPVVVLAVFIMLNCLAGVACVVAAAHKIDFG
jgi:drug/metabolite transporter (DMT)-like permease